jgi:hypothetical protein
MRPLISLYYACCPSSDEWEFSPRRGENKRKKGRGDCRGGYDFPSKHGDDNQPTHRASTNYGNWPHHQFSPYTLKFV